MENKITQEEKDKAMDEQEPDYSYELDGEE